MASIKKLHLKILRTLPNNVRLLWNYSKIQSSCKRFLSQSFSTPTFLSTITGTKLQKGWSISSGDATLQVFSINPSIQIDWEFLITLKLWKNLLIWERLSRGWTTTTTSPCKNSWETLSCALTTASSSTAKTHQQDKDVYRLWRNSKSYAFS